jgi:hypothetical protein
MSARMRSILFVSTLLIAHPVWADEDGGTRSVFALGAGNRALSMGGAFTALADDPLDQPLHELPAVRLAKAVPEDAFFLLPIGGTRRLAKRPENAT